MQRENFKVTSTAGHEFIKHRWNSSIKAVEDTVRELARAEGCVYALIATESHKGEDNKHTHGKRTWQGSTGVVVEFTIAKQ